MMGDVGTIRSLALDGTGPVQLYLRGCRQLDSEVRRL
jgi:hypothetical protein